MTGSRRDPAQKALQGEAAGEEVAGHLNMGPVVEFTPDRMLAMHLEPHGTAQGPEAAWESEGTGEVSAPPGATAVPASLLRGLNPEQLAAVTLPARPALILAGAGSGKTRVLTTRIAWLLQTGQVSPAGVMAVTFTNKAAKEMLTRLSAMLPVNVRGMWIGTFHGLCNRFLRAH